MQDFPYSEKMPIKRPPQYGVCPWWPENGTNWIHPHDVPKTEDFVPGNRVLKRTDFDDHYSLMHYGELSIRVRPMMWLPIHFEGFDIGDAIQVRSLFGKNDSFIASIHEMMWNDSDKRIEYQLARKGRIERRVYRAGDLQHVDKLEVEMQKSEFVLDMDLALKKQLAAENGSGTI